MIEHFCLWNAALNCSFVQNLGLQVTPFDCINNLIFGTGLAVLAVSLLLPSLVLKGSFENSVDTHRR